MESARFAGNLKIILSTILIPKIFAMYADLLLLTADRAAIVRHNKVS